MSYFYYLIARWGQRLKSKNVILNDNVTKPEKIKHSKVNSIEGHAWPPWLKVSLGWGHLPSFPSVLGDFAVTVANVLNDVDDDVVELSGKGIHWNTSQTCFEMKTLIQGKYQN